MNKPNPDQIYVPVRAYGWLIRDNGGDAIATCFNEAMAQKIADLINKDAGIQT